MPKKRGRTTIRVPASASLTISSSASSRPTLERAVARGHHVSPILGGWRYLAAVQDAYSRGSVRSFVCGRGTIGRRRRLGITAQPVGRAGIPTGAAGRGPP